MVRKSRKSLNKRQKQEGGFLGDVISNLTQTAKDAASGIKNIATTAENKLQQGIGKAASGVKQLETKAQEGAKQVATGAKQVVNTGIETINPQVGGKRKSRRKKTKRKKSKGKKTRRVKRKTCKRKTCSCACKKC